MTKRTFLCGVALCLSFSHVAGAQQSCLDLRAALQGEIQNHLQSDPNNQFMNAFTQREMTYYAQCVLWNPGIHQQLAAYEKDSPPTIRVESVGTGLQTPHIDRDSIVFPYEFSIYLSSIGTFLGHDGYLSSGPSLHLPYPLMTTPYRRMMLVPLFEPFGSFLDWDHFLSLKPYLDCPQGDAACAAAEEYGIEAPLLFVLLHENAHQRLHHVNVTGLDPAQEMAADASALAAMKILGDGLNEGLGPPLGGKVRWMFQRAPALWLQADLQREGPQIGAVAAQRLQAVLNSDPTLTKPLKNYITAKHSASNLVVLDVSLQHPVQLYFVDGVVLSPSQVPAGGLIVTNDTHTVVAICTDGIAVSRNFGMVDYTFTAMGDVSAAQLQQDESDKKWEQLLAETSTPNLSPKSSAVLWYQTEALAELNLENLISPSALMQLTGDQLDDAKEWAADVVPLATWGYAKDRVR
jgi:hypothetical protein